MLRKLLVLLISVLLLSLSVSGAEAAVGDFLFKWGSKVGLRSPHSVALDDLGNIYLTDSNDDKVLVLDSTGTVLNEWGTNGSGDGQFNSPQGIVVAGNGNVYVVDRINHRIQVFDSTGTFLFKWGSYGSGDGQFYYPQDIAIAPNGDVYIIDTHNNRVQVFDSTGTFLFKWGSYGSGDGQFYYPQNLAIDANGKVYVPDTSNHRIQVFDSTGTFLFKWGNYGSGDGQFYYPRGIEVDANGKVYVSDTNNQRIQVFDSTGTFLRKWGSYGSGDGQLNSPYDIAVTGNGDVYVADAGNRRLQFFDSGGTFLTRWGGPGDAEGEFNSPQSIAMDQYGDVYVLDNNNYRVQVFDGSGTFIKQWGVQSSSGARGIAVGPTGNVYIADTNNHRILVYDNAGTFLFEWGSSGSGDGQFNSPQGIAVNANGTIYVADSNNYRIQVFDSAGTFLTKWGSYGSGNEQFQSLPGISLDGLGNVYAVDGSLGRVKFFDSSGTYLGAIYLGTWPNDASVDMNGNVYVTKGSWAQVRVYNNTGGYVAGWGDYGASDGQFSSPYGIVVAENGNVYVVDSNNDRIQVFEGVIDADGDGYFNINDCNDNDPAINPAASEIPYTSIDENCNGMADDDDLDNDSYNLINDCNDNDPLINPGASEIFNTGIDENCNGMADDPDVDLDGFPADQDCNDNDPAINPGAEEIPYNGIDENCNGMADDTDFDLDGYEYTNDCNDNDPAINPGMTEIIYTGVDENCNGMADDDDLDLDGYYIATDCNDNDPAINPGVAEILHNGIDENCSGMADDDLDTMPLWVASYYFNDSLAADEYSAPSLIAVNNYSTSGFETATVYGQSRRVYYFDRGTNYNAKAGLSLDTTGLTDLDHYSVEMVFEFTENVPERRRRILNAGGSTSDVGLYVNGSENIYIYGAQPSTGSKFTTNKFHHLVLTNEYGVLSLYLDGNLEIVTQPTIAMNIDNPEDLLDFFLDNGNGYEGADGKVALIRVYDTILTSSDVALLSHNPFDDADLDLDGYGISNDCNDNDSLINPGAAEIFNNGIDENCNGLTDDADLDLDGYGADVDCNDNDAAVNPTASEILNNGIDENCSGMADDDQDNMPLWTASYYFNGTLDAEESYAPSLMAVDPLGLNAFETATIDGQSRSVYSFDGNAVPSSEQAGLSLVSEGLIPSDNYTVEMVFQISDPYASGWWRRILNTNGRTTDYGFYVGPDQSDEALLVYSAQYQIEQVTPFLSNEYYHVILTNKFGIVSVYLDGHLEFVTKDTSSMDISSPEGILYFFLDNAAGPYQDEFADGKIALLRVYDRALPDSDVSILSQNPFDDVDFDLDGFPTFLDCDDSDPLVYPGATEITNNGIDNNCNGMDDEPDLDLDGSPGIYDCNDNDPSVYPGAPEDPFNGIDDNCNGIVDAEDIDGDGFYVEEDCNDLDASIYPGALEINHDGIDQNCDGADGSLAVPFVKVPHAATSTEIEDCNEASMGGNIIAISAYEAERGVDYNNDGDLEDWTLGYFDITTLTFTSIGVDDASTPYVTDGNYIVFNRGPWSSKTLHYYSIATGTLHDTGIYGASLPRVKSVSEGKVAFMRSGIRDLNGDGQVDWRDREVAVYDMTTDSITDIGIYGDGSSIYRDIVTFRSLDTGTIVYYDLSNGSITDTGVEGNWPVIEGNYIVFDTADGLAYYNLSNGTHALTPIFDYEGEYSISRGIIAVQVDEDENYGDLNGDGDINDYYILLYYDIRTGRLVNTGVQGCCGVDISNGVISIETWEEYIGIDLNGDGDIDDCVQQFVYIIMDPGPVAMAGGPYWTIPGSTVELDASGSYHTDSVSGKTIVEWQWDMDGDGVYELTSATPVITVASPDAGNHTISLRVVDNSVPPVTDVTDAVIHSTDRPAAPVILQPSEDVSLYYGESVTFSGSLGENAIEYAWYFNGDLVSSEHIFRDNTLPVGSYVVTYKVKDYLGRWSDPSAPVLVTVLSQATHIDLALEWGDISFWKDGVEITNPGVDDPVTIKATVHNLSTEGTSTPVQVDFSDYYSVDGQWQNLGSATLPAIGPEETETVEFTWTPDPANPKPGYHLIKVYVQSDPTETFTDNNTAAHHLVRDDIQAAGTVSIDIMNLNVSEMQQFYVGDRYVVSGYAQYHWQSGYTTSVLGGTVTILLGGQEFETRTTSSGWFSREVVMPLEAGIYPITVEVSDESIIGQTTKNLDIIEPPYTGPDLAVYNIRLANGVQNMPETVLAYIKNRGGDIASGPFENHIEIVAPSGETEFSNTMTYDNTGELCAGCGVTISFGGWTPQTAGHYQVSVTTDFGNTVAEDNENNNTTTSTLHVYPNQVDLEVVDLKKSCKTISALIRNIGGLTSTTGKLHFSDASVEYDLVDLPPIAGQGGWIWINAAPYSGSLANTPITVTIENNEDQVPQNDSRTEVFDFTDTLDLTVSNLRTNNGSWWSTNTAYIEMSNTLVAEVRNLGCINAPAGSTLRFEVYGVLIEEVSIPSVINGGATTTVSTTFDFAGYAAATDYTLTGTVAVALGSTDTSPGNNTRSEALTVSPQLPDYEVLSGDIDFSTDPGQPDINEDITISADIHNVGMAEGNEFTVAFYEDGQSLIGEIQTFSIYPGILPGEVLTVYPEDASGNTVLWSSPFSGNHTIMVVVAPVAGKEDDPNDANNSATRKVWVNYPPVANVVVTGVTGTDRPDDTVSFSAAGSTDDMDIDGNGGIYSFDWDFGDGQTAYNAGAEVTHQYLNGGAHTATVTVTDLNGQISSASVTVSVSHRITATAGANGTIAPSGDVYVTPGGSQSFTVTPDYGYHILSVDGCSGTLTGSTFETGVMNADCTVTASFEINQYDLTVTVTGHGSVSSSPAGISCEADTTCVASYDHGTVVSLTALGNPGFYVLTWGGACSGTDDCTMTMTADTTATVEFDKYIKMTAPKGNTTWGLGTTQTISWDYIASSGNYVRIELLDAAGSVVETIAESAPIGSNGSGAYNWTIPAGLTPGPNYAIRVTSTSDANKFDTSSGHLTIQ